MEAAAGVLDRRARGKRARIRARKEAKGSRSHTEQARAVAGGNGAVVVTNLVASSCGSGGEDLKRTSSSVRLGFDWTCRSKETVVLERLDNLVAREEAVGRVRAQRRRGLYLGCRGISMGKPRERDGRGETGAGLLWRVRGAKREAGEA